MRNRKFLCRVCRLSSSSNLNGLMWQVFFGFVSQNWNIFAFVSFAFSSCFSLSRWNGMIFLHTREIWILNVNLPRSVRRRPDNFEIIECVLLERYSIPWNISLLLTISFNSRRNESSSTFESRLSPLLILLHNLNFYTSTLTFPLCRFGISSYMKD